MAELSLLPLFSSPVFRVELAEDLESCYQSLRDEQRFPLRPAVEPRESRMSQDNHVLRHFPELRTLLLRQFYDVKNRVLRYESTEFGIATSWITKTDRDEQSHFHIHKNSLFSGVLYFESIEGGAAIEFANYNLSPRSIDVNRPTERNIYNSNSVRIPVGHNVLLFFPSHLFHRITRHEAEQPRYSLAFNMMPVGRISTTADSQYDFAAL
jgi:uncharacterized protein (TIGR02466 family)